MAAISIEWHWKSIYLRTSYWQFGQQIEILLNISIPLLYMHINIQDVTNQSSVPLCKIKTILTMPQLPLQLQHCHADDEDKDKLTLAFYVHTCGVLMLSPRSKF